MTDQERERLAQVIHNDVMQGLAACVLAADLGARFCKSGRVEDAAAEFQSIREGLDAAVAGLREILGDLRIPS